MINALDEQSLYLNLGKNSVSQISVSQIIDYELRHRLFELGLYVNIINNLSPVSTLTYRQIVNINKKS